MRIIVLPRSVLAPVAVAAIIAILAAGTPSDAGERIGVEPPTSTIRIRLKGPTLRVRCRGGDCAITIVREGTAYTVSVTRTRNGDPFTFVRTVENPTNVAVETGIGNDTISLVGVAAPGFLRIGSGFGDDALELTDVSAAGKASIDTGPGSDTVSLTPGTFGGKFRLATRSGNDDVAITGGRFESKAAFDGGPGTDAFSAVTVQFAQPPFIAGFEP